ncbi:MAG TPA: hypothetical protein EYP62_08400 [Kiritimatiellae bacterium]|nr:hypothetical protein [Kiritimatiellia bacterium]
MLKLYRRGLPVTDLVAHRFAFDEAAIGFRKFAAGETGEGPPALRRRRGNTVNIRQENHAGASRRKIRSRMADVV